MSTIEKLNHNMQLTMACAGIDPDISKIPVAEGQSAEDAIYDYLVRYINSVAPHICAFKAQKAFFDLHSGGHDLLKNVVDYVHDNYPHLPVILDCKIGDIDNTMSAYLKNIFGKLGCDGVVVNPYMGDEVLQEAANYPDKAFCVLAKTSNAGGSAVQDLMLRGDTPLWLYVLHLAMTRWNAAGNIVPILSAVDDATRMNEARTIISDSTPILFAGVGAQGRDIAAIADLLNSQQSGDFVNSSRALMYPSLQNGQALEDGMREAATALYESLEAVRLPRSHIQPFFLIMAGVSGVGKTTIIQELKKLDKRFTYISPETTRPLREGETDKIHVPLNELQSKAAAGEYLVVNEINGVNYGTPKSAITRCFEKNLFAVLDFPIDKTDVIADFVQDHVFTVYIAPPSLDELKTRLGKDGRDPQGLRFNSADRELQLYRTGQYDEHIDMHTVSIDGHAADIARRIYVAALRKNLLTVQPAI